MSRIILKKKNNNFFLKKNCFYILDKKLFSFCKKNISNNYFLINSELDKCLKTFKDLVKILIKFKVNRKFKLISIGGGVCGDISGFVSSVFLRGLEYINIPTTVVSQIDSSIGYKNGINFITKNILGTFYKPKKIIISIFFIRRLNSNIYKDGFSEIFKISIINNRNIFYYFLKNIIFFKKRSYFFLKKIFKNSIFSKLLIVNKDPKENFLRMKLNLGHTFSHIIESCSNYKFSHGESVWAGIYLSMLFSLKTNIIKLKENCKIFNFIKKINSLNIIIFSKLRISDIMNKLFLDKKSNTKYINFVFIKKIGLVKIKKISYKIFKKILLFNKKKLFI
ncbi:3-dehydroquinate synthase [Candidatus Vidania fulgoroideorum]